MPTWQVGVGAASTTAAEVSGNLPIWCSDLELGAHMPTELVAPSSSYRSLRCLVRLHGDPLGYISLPLSAGRVSADKAAYVIGATLQAEINSHRDQEGLPPAETITVAGLGPPGSDCPNAPDHTPFISVVVCTRNRADLLLSCVRALKNLTYPHFEVIVVDNAPMDSSTRTTVEQEVGDDVRFLYVIEPRPGLSCARNRGLATARGEIVAYTDDDVSVDPGWLSGVARGFAARADVGCVTGLACTAAIEGPAEAYFDARVSWADSCQRQIFDMSPRWRDGLYPYSPGRFGTGANFAFQTQLLKSLGGFDEALGAGTLTAGGEDLDAFLRVLLAGYAIAYEPAGIVWHHHRADLDDLRKQMFGYGTGLTAFLTKHLLDARTRRALLHRVPSGIRKIVRIPGNTRDSMMTEQAPGGELLLREFLGFAAGPLCYARARRRASATGASTGSQQTPVPPGETSA
jgi:glycosyltransferase involved in cell wall biosynthesis